MSLSGPRVRHPLPPAHWPTRQAAAGSRWFSPIRIGRSLTALERTWVPATVPWRATDALRGQLALWLDDPRWREAPDQSVRAFLLAADRVTHETVLNDRELEALDYGYRERIWDTQLPHIQELPRVLPGLFADAARRAREAGFDGVELHYAHAYTMASFLSRLNTRRDGYGGSRENRVRLPLEVLAAVRARAGEDYVVGIRYLGDEVIEGGSDLDDAVWFGVRFAGAGVDYLSVS